MTFFVCLFLVFSVQPILYIFIKINEPVSRPVNISFLCYREDYSNRAAWEGWRASLAAGGLRRRGWTAVLEKHTGGRVKYGGSGASLLGFKF